MNTTTKSILNTGDRVVLICHQAHTTAGGLINEAHHHTGRIASETIYGNYWVHLDDSNGPPTKCSPTSLRPEHEYDTASSASRQHWIDTGCYLAAGIAVDDVIATLRAVD